MNMKKGHLANEANIGGWRALMTRWLCRENDAAVRTRRLVSVWDERRGAYRSVDLSDRSDPLWDAARTLAACSSRKRTAA